MSIYQERLEVLRGFIAAQATICVTILLVCLFSKKVELVAAVLLAMFLQLIQVYFFGKPSRVSEARRWFSGVVFAIALKYVVFTASLVLLMQFFPSLSSPKVFLHFAGVFFVAYVLPFWYCGIRQAKFSNDIQNQQLTNRV